MRGKKLDYLLAMDIQPWVLREPLLSSFCDTLVMSSSQQTIDSWDDLQRTAMKCTSCILHHTRTHVVFGVGNQHADVMFIGEAPGFHEDKQGKPFVGRAGQLLNAMLISVGLTRDSVYIANILKCRPPENRDPRPEEINQCTPFLEQQIALVKPKLLVALGRIASHFLLRTSISLGQLRKKSHIFANTPLIVTYHPAYLLRNPLDKKKAYQDLQKIGQMLKEERDLGKG